jgi:hypothetical protein
LLLLPIGGKQVDLALKKVIIIDSFSRTGSDMLISRRAAALALLPSFNYLPYFPYFDYFCFSLLSTACFSGSLRVTGSLSLAVYSFRGDTFMFFATGEMAI